MKTINVGMIGMGGIARCHILGWQESPFSNVLAISDIDETKLFNWKSVHQINKIYISAWKLGLKSLYYQHSMNAAQQFKQKKECSSCEA